MIRESRAPPDSSTAPTTHNNTRLGDISQDGQA